MSGQLGENGMGTDAEALGSRKARSWHVASVGAQLAGNPDRLLELLLGWREPGTNAADDWWSVENAPFLG